MIKHKTIPPTETLSSVLSHLMSNNGIKSAELARKTGVGQPVIHRLMTGVTDNPQILTLQPIAQFFGITLDQLLGLSPLSKPKTLDNASQHALSNKLTTVKTIASVLADLLPSLIEGYKKAADKNLISQAVPSDILPLLLLNTTNLLKTINQLQEILTINNIFQD